MRFDGSYVSSVMRDAEMDYFHYVRFYEDGLVITVSSTGSPAEVSRWFDRNDEDIPRGSYTVENGTINFTTVSEYGSVAYVDTVSDTVMRLSYRSAINDSAGSTDYRFVAFQIP